MVATCWILMCFKSNPRCKCCNWLGKADCPCDLWTQGLSLRLMMWKDPSLTVKRSWSRLLDRKVSVYPLTFLWKICVSPLFLKLGVIWSTLQLFKCLASCSDAASRNFIFVTILPIWFHQGGQKISRAWCTRLAWRTGQFRSCHGCHGQVSCWILCTYIYIYVFIYMYG